MNKKAKADAKLARRNERKKENNTEVPENPEEETPNETPANEDGTTL